MDQNKRFGNAVVGQSGGPTAAINATLAGVIRGCTECPGIGTLYGMRNGVEGFLKGQTVDLTARFRDEEALASLAVTPAAALGSCRKKLPADLGDPLYEALFEKFEQLGIRYFFYIGGNDSMDTVAKLSAYAKQSGKDLVVMGVPKTIDNDLSGTDHTPGFGSAAKYIATTMQEIVYDCAVYTVPAVTVVEIMGRDAGWLTASAAIGRVVSGVAPDLVYLPERDFSMERFFEDVRACLAKKPNVVVAVSEGIRFADGHYVCEGIGAGGRDAFGHTQLTGTAKTLELALRKEIGCKVRSIELSLSQRCAGHLASATDLSESVSIGSAAAAAAARGVSGEMMCFERKSTEPYVVQVSHVDVAKCANLVRRVDACFINERGNNVTDECCRYLLPLIRGESNVKYENGLPVYCRL